MWQAMTQSCGAITGSATPCIELPHDNALRMQRWDETDILKNATGDTINGRVCDVSLALMKTRLRAPKNATTATHDITPKEEIPTTGMRLKHTHPLQHTAKHHLQHIATHPLQHIVTHPSHNATHPLQQTATHHLQHTGHLPALLNLNWHLSVVYNVFSSYTKKDCMWLSLFARSVDNGARSSLHPRIGTKNTLCGKKSKWRRTWILGEKFKRCLTRLYAKLRNCSFDLNSSLMSVSTSSKATES